MAHEITMGITWSFLIETAPLSAPTSEDCMFLCSKKEKYQVKVKQIKLRDFLEPLMCSGITGRGHNGKCFLNRVNPKTNGSVGTGIPRDTLGEVMAHRDPMKVEKQGPPHTSSPAISHYL